MPQENEANWLEVIGKALAYLCVQEVGKNDPDRVGDLLGKVKFLESIGVPKADAAYLLGSTPNSVSTLTSRKKAGGSSGKKGKK